MKLLSFIQCWGPGLCAGNGGLERPLLRLLMDEEEARPVAFESDTRKLTPAELAQWLLAWLVLVPARELLLHDAELQQELARLLPDQSTRCTPLPAGLQQGLAHLRVQTNEHIPFSLLDFLGHEGIRAFVQQAFLFQASRPWELLGCQRILQFQRGQQTFGLTLPEARAVAVFENPEEAAAGRNLPIAAFGLMRPALVHWDDLNAMDRLGYRWPRERYPGVTVDSSWLNAEALADLVWLLRQIPALAVTGREVQEGDRQLRLTAHRCRHQGWRRLLRRFAA